MTPPTIYISHSPKHGMINLTDYTRLYRIRYTHARVLKGDCIEFATAARAYSLLGFLPVVSTDCPLLRYGYRSRSDLLRGSYEYRYLSVDYNGDRSGYANGTFSTTKLSLSVTIELE